MSSTPRPRRQRDPYYWPDGVSRADMLRTLPVLGIHVGPDRPFPCVLPGHDDHDDHDAIVHGDTFAYECLGACAIYTRST